MSSNFYNIIADITQERHFQEDKWDFIEKTDWLGRFKEQAELIKKAIKDGEEEEYRRQLITLAALSVAATEAFDRYY